VLSEFCEQTHVLPNIAHWRTFGCTAYAYIPKQKRVQGQKFHVRAQKGKLVGYEGDHIYRIYIPTQNKVIRTSHVTFNENEINPVHPLATSDSEDTDDEDDSGYITLNANHFHPDLPTDSGGVLPLDLHTPPNGGVSSYEDIQTQNQTQHDFSSQESTYESAEEEALPFANQEIQLPQLGRQTLLEQEFEDMSFIVPPPTQQQQLDLPQPALHEHRLHVQDQPVSSSSHSKRKVKQTEKGQQYTQALQQQKDNLEKKRQNRKHALCILPPTVAYCFAVGMDHKPNIQDLPPEPRTWKEAMYHPLSEQWKQAVDKEISQHIKNHTWTQTPHHKD
jgi:hypothetical protein